MVHNTILFIPIYNTLISIIFDSKLVFFRFKVEIKSLNSHLSLTTKMCNTKNWKLSGNFGKRFMILVNLMEPIFTVSSTHPHLPHYFPPTVRLFNTFLVDYMESLSGLNLHIYTKKVSNAKFCTLKVKSIRTDDCSNNFINKSYIKSCHFGITCSCKRSRKFNFRMKIHSL